jgi:hypothetical protein
MVGVGAAAGVGIGIVLVLLLATSSPMPGEHYACVRGSLAATEYNWTPEVILNSPFGGEGVMTYQDPLGAGGGPAQNGISTVTFDMVEWNLTNVDRTLVLGIAPSAPSCPSYDVTSSRHSPPWQTAGGCAGCEILGYGNVTDAVEPTQFNLSLAGSAGVTSVIFHNEFTAQNDGIVSTCGGPFQELSTTASNLAFQVPFSTPHGELRFNETVYTAFGFPSGSYSANFTYAFAADFGTWKIDNLSLGPNAPGGGLAFSFAPCVG